jgi:DnaJ-class molecular chaperone
MARVSEYVECWACDGFGDDRNYPGLPCPVCNGTGETLEYYDDEDYDDDEPEWYA